MPTLTTSVQHSIGSPSHSDKIKRKKKDRKGIQIRREDVILSLFADDMIPQRENSEVAT